MTLAWTCTVMKWPWFVSYLAGKKTIPRAQKARLQDDADKRIERPTDFLYVWGNKTSEHLLRHPVNSPCKESTGKSQFI